MKLRMDNTFVIDGNILRFVLNGRHLVVEYLNETSEATWKPLTFYLVPKKFDIDFFIDILWRTLQQGPVDIGEVIIDVLALTEQS